MKAMHDSRGRKRSGGARSAMIEPLEIRRMLSDASAVAAAFAEAESFPARQMEFLNRGLVAINKGGGEIYLSWRLLATDSGDIAFDVYRITAGAAAIKLNASPITQTTDFVDTGVNGAVTNSYFVRPIVGGVAQPSQDSSVFTISANAAANPYLSLPLQIPTPLPTPDGAAYSYNANDASVGDVDGDGQYEIILKWDPTNAKDNSQSGYTGNVYIDAYRLDGTLLWRIDLGRNIRAGAHYTQFMVYDLDGDGRAEVAMKTAPGTIDGVGNYVLLNGDDPDADYRNSGGYVLAGPEYLTIFNGLNGAAMATVPYIVPRGNVGAWGDTYGNRVDRFLACVAYLDGQRPSLVMARGYYTRATLAAWDWRNGQLTQRWLFDSDDGTPGNSLYRGQGNHNLSVADVDADGKDEIIYGAAVINDDGKGLFSTRLGHGDALHVGDLDPSRPGLEVFGIHENPGSTRPGSAVYDAASGQLIWGTQYNSDVGRGVAADIDPNNPGAEAWSNSGGLWSASTGAQISTQRPSSANFLLWWDADLVRELEDGTSIYKWNPGVGLSTIVSAPGVSSNNGTKSTPALSGDIMGDWREEVVWRTSDNTELRIYTTTIPAANRIYTLMHDPKYRLDIAWQNVAYNQPPHPGFFLGADMEAPPTPNIYLAQGTLLPPPAPPSGLSAAVAGLNHIDLAWSPSPAVGVTYRVRRSTLAGGPYTVLVSDLTATTFSDKSAVNGTSYYYVVTANDTQPAESIFSNMASAKVPVPLGTIRTYQAEGATIGGGAVISTEHSGFNGTGYIDFPDPGNTTGFLEFNNIDGGGGGVTTIRWRFALGIPPTRNGSMIVNGVSQGIFFPSTFNWSMYAPIEFYIDLKPGPTNTIRLQVTGNDLGNIDELIVVTNPDLTPPTVINGFHKYAATPNTLSFLFSKAVDPSIGLNDLAISLLGSESAVQATAFVYDAARRMATYTLPAGMVDGNYRATFISGSVIDSAGNALPGTFAFDFFVLNGDANHDRKVDGSDLQIVMSNWLKIGMTFDQGDFTGDGIVNDDDLSILTSKWEQELAGPASPTPPLPSRPPIRKATRVMSLVE